MELFLQQILATSFLEWCAVILALAYLILAINESLWCWPSAFFSTAIYVWLFFDVNLFMESILNAYYLAMAIYGWLQWNNIDKNMSHEPSTVLTIIRWKLKNHFLIILIGSLLILFIGFFLSHYTSQVFPYLDSFTTIFALIATFMVAKKVLENWIYWIIIDIISVYLFYSKGLILTSVLFAVYVVLAIVGWYKWNREYKLTRLKLNSAI